MAVLGHRVKPFGPWPERRRLKYDLFYIETMSLGLDTKILFRTVRTALAGAGR